MISHWLHRLVIDFIHYSLISSPANHIWQKEQTKQTFPALFYPSYSTCELSFRRPSLFSHIRLIFVIYLLNQTLTVAPSRLFNLANSSMSPWGGYLLSLRAQVRIKNNLYLRLTPCLDMLDGYLNFLESLILSTGRPVIKKNMSNTESQTKKWYKKARKLMCLSCAL